MLWAEMKLFGTFVVIVLCHCAGIVSAKVLSRRESRIFTQWTEGCGVSQYPNAGEGVSGQTQQQNQHEKRQTVNYHHHKGYIVGGIDAMEGEFPWQVAIYEGSYFACGGVLIDTKRILTAGHCVDDIFEDYTVALGENNRQNPPSERRIVHLRFDQIYIHEMYNDRTGEYDIAMIVLDESESVTPTDLIRPVCSPRLPDYSGKPAIVSGWGFTSVDGYVSNTLKYTNVTVLDTVNCQLRYEDIGFIYEHNICAGDSVNGGKDACSYDSGGPLAFKNEDGVFELIGLVSWGENCGIAELPGVYTSVVSLLPWIDSTPAT